MELTFFFSTDSYIRIHTRNISAIFLNPNRVITDKLVAVEENIFIKKIVITNNFTY